MKYCLPFILFLFSNMQAFAQEVAVSEKVKSTFQIPLSSSGNKILILTNGLKLERWDQTLTTKTVTEIDDSELDEIGENYITDVFVIGDKLVLVEEVYSKNPDLLSLYMSQYDLEGNILQSWEKLVEIERANKNDNSYYEIFALSPDKSKYIWAVTSKKSKENAKYIIGTYDFATNKVGHETFIQTEIQVEAIDYSLLSLNDQGEYALWVGGEMDRTSRKSESNMDVHHLYLGNNKTTDVKGYPLNIPNKLIGKTSILMQQNGDVLAMGVTTEDVKEPNGTDGYYRAALKKGTELFDFHVHKWNSELLQKYYSSHKVEVLSILPPMVAKNIFVHESGDVTFVAEEYFQSVYVYQGVPEISDIFGSVYAVRMDSVGNIIKDDLCFKYRRSPDLKMLESLAFLSNDMVRIIFTEHSDIWQSGQRVFELSSLKQSQPYYCSLTCASFGAEGFTYDQIDTKRGKKMCVHMYPTSFLGGKTLLGIGRQVNALHYVRITLP